jgi:hypothetical protein
MHAWPARDQGARHAAEHGSGLALFRWLSGNFLAYCVVFSVKSISQCLLQILPASTER